MITAPCKSNETPEERESITFIMGEDHDSDNPYYTEAHHYYLHNPNAQTDHVINHCHSLIAARNYLEEHSPKNGLPWGLVNIVLHSNEWSGLGVPVFDGGTRSSLTNINQAIANGRFLPLEDTVIDSQTEIVLQACALGKNQAMLKAISHAFGGATDLERPIVRSSKYFIFYESTKYNGIPQDCHRYLVDAKYVFYKMGYRPGDIRLSQQLQAIYPDVETNWRDALSRTSPRFLGDIYHHTFEVPIIWTVTYPDIAERPDLSTKAAQEIWLNAQPELDEAIQQFGIPKDKFNWVFKNIDYTFEDGVTEPGIKAVGYCTVLCVLQTLTQPDSNNPNNVLAFIPEITDEQYYAVEKP